MKLVLSAGNHQSQELISFFEIDKDDVSKGFNQQQ